MKKAAARLAAGAALLCAWAAALGMGFHALGERALLAVLSFLGVAA